MTDPAGPPMWLLIVVGLSWMFALGVWVERHRPGGTADLRDDVGRLAAERDRVRAELTQRRRSSMSMLQDGVTGDNVRDLTAALTARDIARRPAATL